MGSQRDGLRPLHLLFLSGPLIKRKSDFSLQQHVNPVVEGLIALVVVQVPGVDVKMQVPKIRPEVCIIHEPSRPRILADIVFSKEAVDKFVHL